MTAPTFDQSQEFFKQLEIFSARARQYLNGKPNLSPWGEPKLKTSSGYPDGIVLHYTAGPTLESAVKWLCNTRDQCGSAHVVVADKRLPWAEILMTDLNAVRALPVTCVQLRLPNSMAYHATVANGTHYGIEMANIGPTPPRTVDPTGQYDRKETVANSIIAAGQVFKAYTSVQLQSVAKLGAYVVGLGGNVSHRSILGHEHVQGPATKNGGGHDKRDPGVGFNFSKMRDAIISKQGNDPFLDASLETLERRMSFSYNRSNANQQITGMLQDAYSGRSTQMGRETLMAAQLMALGYHINGSAMSDSYSYFSGDSDTGKENRDTLMIFQRLMGLIADGVPGPKTSAALVSRVEDRWIKRSMLDVSSMA